MPRYEDTPIAERATIRRLPTEAEYLALQSRVKVLKEALAKADAITSGPAGDGGMRIITPSEEMVERTANALWSNLDLNGHTLDGVKRAAIAAITAIQEKREE